MNKLQTVGLLFLITLVCPTWVQAQGKLGRARAAVRQAKTKPKPAAKVRKEDPDKDEDRDKKKNKKRKSKQPRRNRSVQLIASPFFLRSNPRPVVNQIHVHETVVVSPTVLTTSPTAEVLQPILHAQPGLENAYESVIEESIVSVDNPNVSTEHSQASPIAQPLITSSEPADVLAPPEVEPHVGDPYFHSPNDWISRFTVQGGSDFDGLGQGGMGLLFQSGNSLGIETSVTMFRESGTEFRDHLWLGDVNLLFEPISGDVRLRFGVGVNWLGDSHGGEAGFNLTASTDVQLTNRCVLTGEIDYGTLGDSDLFHSQVTLGATFGNREVFAGYNYYDIGGAELDGVVFGLRFRF